ncbi:MAG: protein phosphatase 2C domain-containing protein [Ignavibacteriaceae bacterium]|nr:protein phosphatase 2C domain-containing protein [Ignavibacteriaceae bacterium]
MTASKPVEISSFGLSHIGNVRKDNQDAFRICNLEDNESISSFGYLFGVADGMGGYAHGGIASTLALETFFETFYSANGASPIQKFRVGIQNANLSVYQSAQRMKAGRMGTTLTVTNLVGQNLYVGHVGDSRAYLIRNHKSDCITNDHTQVGDLVRMRILSPDKVRTHNQRSVLNKCIGLNLFVQPDIFKISVQKDDILILCTDGVWSVIEDEEFGQITKKIPDPEAICREIIDLALKRDSDDNLSIVTLRFKNFPHKVKEADNKSNFVQNIFKRFTK